MSHENSDDSASRPWCQDVPWSTFNHRVTGTFLLLWGVSALIVAFQWPMRTWWRFVPPMFLFGLAEFLFFRNDPEAFPVGPKSYWVSLQDPEVFQHRVFLLLIILMAAIELLRAAERLPGLLAKYALPALGTFGAIYLFFHKHASGSMGAMMSHPATNMAPDPSMQQMMLSMNLIRHEHAWFSILGFGLVAAKLLGDTGHLKGRWGVMLWPLFAIVLGSYMMAYVE